MKTINLIIALIILINCKPVVSNISPGWNGTNERIEKLNEKEWEIRINFPNSKNNNTVFRLEQEATLCLLERIDDNTILVKWKMNEERWKTKKPFLLSVETGTTKDRFMITISEKMNPVIDTILRAASWSIR